MSQERTRFPITPQERHETAKSFDDVDAKPEQSRPREEARPQDKPYPQDRSHSDDEDKPDADNDEPEARTD